MVGVDRPNRSREKKVTVFHEGYWKDLVDTVLELVTEKGYARRELLRGMDNRNSGRKYRERSIF